MRFPLNNRHICAVEIKPGLGGDIAKPPNSSCVYKACTTDVQGMYKGCTRDVQGSNRLAIPWQHRSNTLATRFPDARPTVHRHDDFREQAGYSPRPASGGRFAATPPSAISPGKWLARGGGR